MGHCKHQWQERTDVLRDVFAATERRKHSFYVCARCLKIDEVLAAPVSLERPAAAPRPWDALTAKEDAA